MKIYVAFAAVLSVLIGLLPVLIAKTTDQGDELCDPDLFYAATRQCALLWDRALLAFGLYFAMSAAFFITLALIRAAVIRLR